MSQFKYKVFPQDQRDRATSWQWQKVDEGFSFGYERMIFKGPMSGQLQIIMSKEELSDSEVERIFEENE
jgi:hypothetical protein